MYNASIFEVHGGGGWGLSPSAPMYSTPMVVLLVCYSSLEICKTSVQLKDLMNDVAAASGDLLEFN